MNTPQFPSASHRELPTGSGTLAAAGALAGVALPHVHAAGSDQVSVALIGCGGRGGGAASNAMSQSGPPKLVAMADVFDHRLKSSYETLKRKHKDQVDVPEDRKFIGFDAYKGAMDCLKKGDVAIFTTPMAFRWVHFKYAIEKGLNVFMEKPLTADGPTSRRMLKLAEEASAKNLKVGVGLKSRHSRALQELHKRIQDGEIGDITLMRGYRMQGPIGSAYSTKWPGQPSELMWQISRFHSFLWASGGGYSDFNIHHIDHLCWMKNAWPVKAQGVGARHYRNNPEGVPYVDQNFDSYSVEYTFADGAKMIMDGRGMLGATPIYASFAHGTKGMAIVSKQGDCGRPSSTYRKQAPANEHLIWKSKEAKDGPDDPFLNEWAALIEAIRNDKPFNEAPSGVYASVATSLGRYAAHTGQEVTFDEFLNHEHEYAPGVDKLTFDSPAPLQAGPNGKYPVPEPGIKKNREF
ncbi:MAG: streptomycin biosynthesis protein StrI [Pedosphaera sp. Tous-C6FEB]|nr:MAG: streptomycin biosynthesis protein StrI [Pedosphaera sp. Tous-C6FEB]